MQPALLTTSYYRPSLVRFLKIPRPVPNHFYWENSLGPVEQSPYQMLSQITILDHLNELNDSS